LASRELNLIIFSCSAGSLSAMTPSLPKRSQPEKPLNPSTLLVTAVMRLRRAGSARKRSSATVRTLRPTSRNAL
jgi:hypothetical protein